MFTFSKTRSNSAVTETAAAGNSTDGSGRGAESTKSEHKPGGSKPGRSKPNKSNTAEMVDGGSISGKRQVPASLNTDAETSAHLRALGLPPGANWEQVTEAHRRLVSDLTPGPGASHQNVQLAERFLGEVNRAYASLRTVAVA